MPQVEIVVGDRSFEVACQPGEEAFLRAAAAILDGEATALSSQIGRMPEARMLLMAGLMLADKASGLEERLREAEARLADAEAAAMRRAGRGARRGAGGSARRGAGGARRRLPNHGRARRGGRGAGSRCLAVAPSARRRRPERRPA